MGARRTNTLAYPDGAIAALAAGQHGVVTRAQLKEKGLSDDVVDGRIARGLLRPLHRGVFQVGPIAVPLMHEAAACLACGPASWIGVATATVMWRFLDPPTAPQNVDVIVRHGYHQRTGIRLHRVPGLRAAEVTHLHGIPITRPGRTLLDLAGSASPRDLERAVAQALARRLTTRAELRLLLRRWPRRAGTTALRACLEVRPALTRSEAEERFLLAVRRARLPEPETNVRVAGYEVDFLWSAQRLIVEIDGFAFHAAQDVFENDRRRDLVLTSLGMRVMRVTWRQLMNEQKAVLARVAQALGCEG